MDYLQWKTQMRSEYFSRNVLAGNINRWKNITADGLFRKNGTTTIWIWKHWNNLMVNNCSKRNSNWEIDMIEWLELKSKFQWKRNIQLASILQIIKIIPKQIHIQCSLGLLPPVLSPNLPIAKILVCPDFPHYKYPVILPNSATAIRHSFSDTKVVKPI
jgi:hypothetical protein